jgi:hypothetical protein
MPIVVAVVLGPLIAGLAVCVLATVSNLLDLADSLPVVDLFKMFGFFIVFAYISGVGIALLAGILVSIWMMSRPPSLIVVIAAALLATAIYLGLSALGLLKPVEITSARADFLVIFAVAMIAAIGCWLLTRRFALRQ